LARFVWSFDIWGGDSGAACIDREGTFERGTASEASNYRIQSGFGSELGCFRVLSGAEGLIGLLPIFVGSLSSLGSKQRHQGLGLGSQSEQGKIGGRRQPFRRLLESARNPAENGMLLAELLQLLHVLSTVWVGEGRPVGPVGQHVGQRLAVLARLRSFRFRRLEMESLRYTWDGRLK
jgi:hypothetical protein